MEVKWNSFKDHQWSPTPRDQDVRYRYRSTSTKGTIGRNRNNSDKLKNKCRDECLSPKLNPRNMDTLQVVKVAKPRCEARLQRKSVERHAERRCDDG